MAIAFIATIVNGAEAARAALAACPEIAGEKRCFLIVDGTEFSVTASDQDGGDFLIDQWLVGGVSQLSRSSSGFTFRDFTTPGPVGALLEEASIDAEVNTIFVQFREVGGGLVVRVEFHVSGGANTSMVEETITLSSDRTVNSRLYVVMDFDLEGDPTDALIFADPSGSPITQSDGQTSAQIEVVSGPAPSGFEVAPCCSLLAYLAGSDSSDLANNTTTPGVADFQSALSWDEILAPGGSYAVMLQKRITVPEPDAAAAGALAAAALLAIARARGAAARRGGAAGS
jgi:hypothetical protein